MPEEFWPTLRRRLEFGYRAYSTCLGLGPFLLLAGLITLSMDFLEPADRETKRRAIVVGLAMTVLGYGPLVAGLAILTVVFGAA